MNLDRDDRGTSPSIESESENARMSCNFHGEITHLPTNGQERWLFEQIRIFEAYGIPTSIAKIAAENGLKNFWSEYENCEDLVDGMSRDVSQLNAIWILVHEFIIPAKKIDLLKNLVGATGFEIISEGNGPDDRIFVFHKPKDF